MEPTYKKKRECILCDEPIPDDREDTICEGCRAARIVARRNMREKITLMPEPVQFAPRRD